MYVCGPTVYDKAHVGHAMSSIVFDVIRRYLEYKGYQVVHVMNYTDVDDKVILRAQELQVDPLKLAETYIHEYDELMQALNILEPHVKPRVSTEIQTILEMVEGLIKKGYAYEIEGGVYFQVEKDEDYGKLSRRKLEDMRAGFRLDVDQRKRDPADFALWKAAKPGEPAWQSPWGTGRPGWHIECSAMSLHHLGEQIDIHGGGNDLIFPHHENEIAQSEGFTQKPFARYWVHNGMMQMAGEAMSKSTGNVYTVERFLSEYEGEVLRLLVLNSSYRSPLTFNEEAIQHAARALERLRSALRPGLSEGQSSPEIESLLQAKIEETYASFEEAMDDDFNTASALGSLFELVRVINQARDQDTDDQILNPTQTKLKELAGILGLRLQARTVDHPEVDRLLDLILEIRNRLREVKQYELADLVRERLEDLGVVLEDTKDRTTWRWR